MHQQHAGGADQRTSRLDQQVAAERTNDARELRGPGRFFRRLLRRVANAESAAAIEIAERDARARKFAHKSSQARQSAAVRSKRQNLRSDMRADSLPVDPARIAVLKIEAARGLPINSKFVAMMSGGNVRMAAGFDVRIDADGRRGAHAQARRLRSQQVELRGRLHIEKKNPRAQRLANFLARFPDAGKNDAISRHADSPQAIELAARNDVESAAERGKHSQNAQIRIGFHRRSKSCAGACRTRNPCGDRLARCSRGCRDTRAFRIASRLRRRTRLRNRVATRDRKIREYSSPDRQRRQSGKRANGKTRRSLDFHHHQRAIVRDGASLREFLALPRASGRQVRSKSSARWLPEDL